MSSHFPSDGPIEYKTTQDIHWIAACRETNKGRSIIHVICLLTRPLSLLPCVMTLPEPHITPRDWQDVEDMGQAQSVFYLYLKDHHYENLVVDSQISL